MTDTTNNENKQLAFDPTPVETAFGTLRDVYDKNYNDLQKQFLMHLLGTWIQNEIPKLIAREKILSKDKGVK